MHICHKCNKIVTCLISARIVALYHHNRHSITNFHMKKIFFILFFGLMSNLALYSQSYGLQLITKSSLGVIPKKSVIVIEEIKRHATIDSDGTKLIVEYLATCKYNDTYYTFELRNIQESCKIYNNIGNKDDFWLSEIIFNKDLLNTLKKFGPQTILRDESSDDALEYINKLTDANLIFDDPLLENYLYTLLHKIRMTNNVFYKNGNINVVVLKSTDLNASIYPDGTLLLTTGLLANLNSEAELAGVLAHEIAHYMLDHSIVNITLMNQRIKRAEFWAAIATGIVAAAEVVAASQSNYYYPVGAATAATSAIASTIANSIISRLGMEYNQEQELEADRLAVNLLKLLNYNENAYATALSNLQNYQQTNGNYSYFFNSSTHPSLLSRIIKSGKVVEIKDLFYKQQTSFAISNFAVSEFFRRNFHASYKFAKQNIDNKVADDDDYTICSASLQIIKDTPESNKEAMDLLNKAYEINPNNININKYKCILYLRMKEYNKAKEALNEYMTLLNKEIIRINDIKGQQTWENSYAYLCSENSWANKMVIKLNGMHN